MHLLSIFTTISLLSQYTIAQDTPSPTVQPADFSGDDTPYQVVPTGTDIPPGDASVLNKLGIWLYGYTDCEKVFGSEAKGKIDGAYYDAWVMSNTDQVASNIDWNNAAALEFLGAPGLNKDKQSQIQAVLANAATVIYSNKNIFQHYLKVRCDNSFNVCQNRPGQPK